MTSMSKTLSRPRVLEDPQYFGELHGLAIKQGYTNGVLSPGLLCCAQARTVAP